MVSRVMVVMGFAALLGALLAMVYFKWSTPPFVGRWAFENDLFSMSSSPVPERTLDILSNGTAVETYNGENNQYKAGKEWTQDKGRIVWNGREVEEWSVSNDGNTLTLTGAQTKQNRVFRRMN